MFKDEILYQSLFFFFIILKLKVIHDEGRGHFEWQLAANCLARLHLTSSVFVVLVPFN